MTTKTKARLAFLEKMFEADVSAYRQRVVAAMLRRLDSETLVRLRDAAKHAEQIGASSPAELLRALSPKELLALEKCVAEYDKTAKESSSPKPKRETPPGANPAARNIRTGARSSFDRVRAFSVLGLGGNDRQAHLLADHTGQETAHAVRLPVRRFHQFLTGDATRAFEQFQDLGGLAARTRRSSVRN